MKMYSNHAGIHLSTTKLQLVEISHSNNSYYLENADEEYFNDFIRFNDKETKFITILQNAFNIITQRKSLKSNFISFSIPANVFKVFQIPFDEALRKNDLLEHVRWEFKVLYPGINLDEYTFQTVAFDNFVKTGGKRLMVFALSKEIIRTLHKFCERNNLELKFVDSELLSANNIVRLSLRGKHVDNYILYLLRDNYSVVVLFNQSLPVYYVARKLRSLKAVGDTLNSDLEKISVAFEFNLEIDRAYITGSNVSDSVVDQLNRSTGMNFSVVNPFKRLNIPHSFNGKISNDETCTDYSAAAGVAYRLF